jgi:hypothetical protein
MQLQVVVVDMRGGYGNSQSWTTDVIDKETGKVVGFVYQENKPAKRYISLFDGKYVGHFDDIGRCVAFAKGVEAVLNHMVALPASAETQAAASMPEAASVGGLFILGLTATFTILGWGPPHMRPREVKG